MKVVKDEGATGICLDAHQHLISGTYPKHAVLVAVILNRWLQLPEIKKKRQN